MKPLACFLTLLVLGSSARADEIQFWLNRYGGIDLQTTKGKEKVRVYQGDKHSEHTILESRLLPVSAGVYATPKGTRFTLKHLDQPIISDENRHQDSGDWQLTVSGEGKEFERLKAKMPFVTFGDLPPLVYLGTKVP